MEFTDYRRINELQEICRTEHSEIFLTEDKKICKYYFDGEDRKNECFFYDFFNENDLMKTPRLFYVGEDFIEMELLKEESKPDLREIVREVSNLYKKTREVKLPISRIDLSKERLFSLIDSIKEETEKKGIDSRILSNVRSFVQNRYSYPKEECVVHGDLKYSNIFNTKGGIKFIDFALSKIANPIYDLAFLCMEEPNKFEEVEDSCQIFEEEFGLNKAKIKDYLNSAIFYRTFYLFSIALKNRPQKFLNELVLGLNNAIEK